MIITGGPTTHLLAQLWRTLTYSTRPRSPGGAKVSPVPFVPESHGCADRIQAVGKTVSGLLVKLTPVILGAGGVMDLPGCLVVCEGVWPLVADSSQVAPIF